MDGLFKVAGCDNPNREADVVFVHGLDGDSHSTWQCNGQPDSFWPKWLGADFPKVGVWSLGYAVSSTAWRGHAMPLADRATHTLERFELDGIGTKPILFICHSLGGLLVKQLLRHATDSTNPAWKGIAKQTRVIVFLSTPHSGAGLAGWIKYLGTLLRPTVSVDELQAHDASLRDLNQWYRDHVGELGITTFVYYEKVPTRGILVVNESTADPGIAGVRPVPLDEDHISICKPTSRESLVYRRVQQLLQGKVLASAAPNGGHNDATISLNTVRPVPVAEHSTSTHAGSAPVEGPVDFVLITPLAEERDALLRLLDVYERAPPIRNNAHVYFTSRLQVTFSDQQETSYRLVIAPLIDMGRVEANDAAKDAIQRWEPRYIVLVGIAGGYEKASVSLGDVLIATTVADYEEQKLRTGEPQIRWQVFRTDAALLAASQNVLDDAWLSLIKSRRPDDGKPRIVHGVMCTGDKVVANGLLDDYQDVWSRLVGVEMEAGGVAHAAVQAAHSRPGFFMVRGVSDLSDGNKDAESVKQWRAYACDVAAAFVIALLKNGPVPASERDASQANALGAPPWLAKRARAFPIQEKAGPHDGVGYGRTIGIIGIIFLLLAGIGLWIKSSDWPHKSKYTEEPSAAKSSERTFALAGSVVDATTKKPLEGVTLTIGDLDNKDGTTPTCQTDAAGRFRFRELVASESRQVSLVAQKEGYDISRTDPTLGTESHVVTLISAKR